MYNTLIGISLLAVSSLGIIVSFKSYARRSEHRAAKWLVVFSALIALWAIVYALFFLLPDTGNLFFILHLTEAITSFASMVMFLFLYKTFVQKKLRRPLFVSLLLLPAVDTVVILASYGTGFFMTSSGVFLQDGIRQVNAVLGPWTVVHSVICYAASSAGLIFLIAQLQRLPAGLRAPTVLLLVGLAFLGVAGLNQAFHMFASPINLSPYLVQITTLLFYNGLFNTRSFDTIYTAKNAFFDDSENLLFVTDAGGYIVDSNLAARDVAEKKIIDISVCIKPEEFIDEWLEAADGNYFEEDPTIFSVHEGDTDVQYQIHKHVIIGPDGEDMGSYFELENVKPIMSFIHLLQDAAYYDSMTGLPNRNHFSKKLTETDFLLRFPLCVMVGDVNKLKYVNDTFGHVKGDDLLMTIAKILAKCAPPGAFIARTGGDEFVGLMPEIDSARADEFIKEVDRLCAEAKNPEYGDVSIALGYKIRTSEDEDVQELLKAADAEMYSHKRDRRKE
jgi:diguanylate cyclase (GGDEF)-like protein